MPSNVTKFGSLKGSNENLEKNAGRFGLVTTELHSEPAAPSGEHLYYIPGNYTWVAPAGVLSVSVVCVGGGGGGYQQGFFLNFFCNGGGGGTLAYKNNFPVVPGQGYDLKVGAGGAGFSDSFFPSTIADNGEQSWFNNTSTCAAGGGEGGYWLTASWGGNGAQVQAAAPVGDGGGRGGYANIPEALNNPTQAYASGEQGCGSGAGGYSGDGGGITFVPGTSGPGLQLQSVPPAPFGGGGMHGYIGWTSSSAGMNGGPGGGVGVYGLGLTASTPGESGSGGRHASNPTPNPANKAVPTVLGTYNVSVKNGSNAVNNSPNNNPGLYGGGGGGPGNVGLGTGPVGNGGNGAVRIIWGTGRVFPSTLTDEASSLGFVSNN